MIALDLGSATTFDVASTRQYAGGNHRTSLRLEYSNPYIFSKAVKVCFLPSLHRDTDHQLRYLS